MEFPIQRGFLGIEEGVEEMHDTEKVISYLAHLE